MIILICFTSCVKGNHTCVCVRYVCVDSKLKTKFYAVAACGRHVHLRGKTIALLQYNNKDTLGQSHSVES